MIEKKRVIIDTDTAGDDTIAILTALHYFQVEGITITGGNVEFDQQVENALYTIEVAGKSGQVPVYKGYERPLMGLGEKQHRTVEDVHGKDGMGIRFLKKPSNFLQKDMQSIFSLKQFITTREISIY